MLVLLPTRDARSERWRRRDQTSVMTNSVTTCKSGRAHEVSILIVGREQGLAARPALQRALAVGGPVETLHGLEWSFLATVGPLLLGAALIAVSCGRINGGVKRLKKKGPEPVAGPGPVGRGASRVGD